MAYEGVHLPAGYDVAVKNDLDAWVDLGVTMEGGTLEATYETTKITGSKAEAILTAFRSFSVASSFTLAQIKLENLSLLMTGAADYAVVDTTPVAVSDEDLLTGEWELDTFIPFANQSANGAVPTAITLANDGALTLNTDYLVIQGENGQWGVYILDTVATDTAETLELNYTYTPAASKTLSMGSRSVEVSPRAFRIRKNLGTTAVPKYFGVEIYAATNEAGLSLNFPRYDNEEITTLEVSLIGDLDTTRSDLDQLLKITDETAA